jgi:hypothetical protein
MNRKLDGRLTVLILVSVHLAAAQQPDMPQNGGL